MRDRIFRFRVFSALALSVLLVGVASTSQAQVDHFMAYQAQETDKKNDTLGKDCNVTIDDACFGEKENLNVSKVKALYLPAMKNDEPVFDPNTHLIGYQVKPSKQGIAPPQGKCSKTAPQNASQVCDSENFCGGLNGVTTLCEKTKFLKGQKHVKHESKTGTEVNYLNQFGLVTVDTNKRELLLVPTRKSHTGEPASVPDGSVDHYLCYKAKESKVPGSIPGISSQQDEKGKLRQNLQVLVGDQFAEGSGHPQLDPKVLVDVKKVTRVCNPVLKSNIDTATVATSKNETRTTTCSIAETTEIQNRESLVCYQAKLASKVYGTCSDDPNSVCKKDTDCSGGTCDLTLPPNTPGYPFPTDKAGLKLDPKIKHLKFEGKSGNALFVKHQFGNPAQVDTKKELDFCVPSFKDPRCGDGEINLPGEECDDGNTDDEDGCSSQCIVEFCGDGIVQTKFHEFCDPPGSSTCPGAVTCSDTCLCPATIGTQACIYKMDATCKGGNNDGEVCTDTQNHTDCPPGPSHPTNPARCISVSEARVNNLSESPFLTIGLDGSVSVTCDQIDPNTGLANCSCDLIETEPVILNNIGIACLDPISGCPEGQIDCDGGTAISRQLVSEHNAANCGIDDFFITDPNDPTKLICATAGGVPKPCTGNSDCATNCGLYCDFFGQFGIGDPNVDADPNIDYRVFSSGCEGYCTGGQRDGLPCVNDIDCIDSACAGGEPVEHTNTCQCQCIKEFGAETTRPGDFNCEIGLFIVLERIELDANGNIPPASICDGENISLRIAEQCVPFATDVFNAVTLGVDQEPNDPRLGPDIVQGTPISCAQLATGDTTGLVIVGNSTSFDSSNGDLSIPIQQTCE